MRDQLGKFEELLLVLIARDKNQDRTLKDAKFDKSHRARA